MRRTILAALTALSLFACHEPPAWQPVAEAPLGHDIDNPSCRWTDGDPGDTLMPDRSVEGETSRKIVHGIFHLPLVVAFAMACMLAIRYRRRVRAWEAPEVKSTFSPGPAVLFGQVEVASRDNDSTPVCLKIRQNGYKRGLAKGGYAVTWREIRRTLQIEPFFIRLDDGQRVLVEGDANTRFEGMLGATQKRSNTHRMRIASLRVGTRIMVRGWRYPGSIAGQPDGYRGLDRGPEIRSAATTPLLIVTEEVREQDRRFMLFHMKWALAALVALLLGALLLVPTYELLSIDGRVETAVISAHRHWTKLSDALGLGLMPDHYVVRGLVVRDGAPLAVAGSCSRAVVLWASKCPGRPVPFLVSRWLPSVHQIGIKPTISEAAATLLFLGTFFFCLAQIGFSWDLRPWNVRRLLIEEEHADWPD